MENNKPIHQVRIGRIKAAIFDNGDDAPRKVQFTASTRTERRGKVRKVLLGRICPFSRRWPIRFTPTSTSKTVQPARWFLEASPHHRPPTNSDAEKARIPLIASQKTTEGLDRLPGTRFGLLLFRRQLV